MKVRPTLLVVSSGVIAVSILAISLSVAFTADTTLEFHVRDAVSGKWVWNLTAQLQGREIRGFYQSDLAPTAFRFTQLVPGKATLELSSPAYEPVAMPVVLRRGVNRLEGFVNMVGVEIPDLSHFVVFESLNGSDIFVQIRPVSTDGKAVLNHPCIDLWIGCRVSVQTKGGVPLREETESGSHRGEELFRGPIHWQWDSAPETTFRYTARIPGTTIKNHYSLYRVIDYLIVVPDPREITQQEVRDLMSRIYEVSDPAFAPKALDREKGHLRYFVNTSWNVKARQE